MPLDENWASYSDFATLFQYFWYRDFPIDKLAIGARRSDWTIHIGIVIRNIADLLGLVARFESGKRKDAVLRSTDGDEIAIEWEWEGIFGKANEFKKLREHKLWPKNREKLKYAVLITYADSNRLEDAYNVVDAAWRGAPWSLLLILIDVTDVPKSEVFTGKQFNHVHMSVFDGVKYSVLRTAPAVPWKVSGVRMNRGWSN